MDFQIARLSTSTYLDAEFNHLEKTTLEKIPGLSYVRDPSSLKKGAPTILISNTHTQVHKISENLLEQTKLIIHPNSGYDNFSLDFLKNWDIPVALGNQIRAQAVSEFILSAIFKHNTPIPEHHFWSEQRTWKRNLLRDQKVFIVGFGVIGKILNAALSPIVQEIKIYDPYELKHDESALIQNIQGADILILAASANKKNKKMINHDLLKKISNKALIINAARGDLIHENDLFQFLKNHSESYAYLDVFTDEPFKPNFFQELTNVNKTSHIAGVYSALPQDIIEFEYFITKNFIQHAQRGDVPEFLNQFRPYLLKTKFKGDMLI